MSSEIPKVKTKEVYLAICKANRVLCNIFYSDIKSAQKALKIILPYVHHEEFELEPHQKQNSELFVRKFRGFTLAFVGDCYRILGDFETAAKYYYWAAYIKKSHYCAPFYASIVIQHNMTEHFRFAYRSLRIHNKQTRLTTFGDVCVHVFFFGFIQGWPIKPSIFASMWKMHFWKKKYLTQLEEKMSLTPGLN